MGIRKRLPNNILWRKTNLPGISIPQTKPLVPGKTQENTNSFPQRLGDQGAGLISQPLKFLCLPERR